MTQVSAAPAGPYHVTVWTAPDPARAETPLHVTIAVAGESQQPVLDAAILVQLYAAGANSPIVTGAATTAQSTNKLFYEVDFSPPATGPHRIEVTVTGAEGEGTVAFHVEVEPAAGMNWPLLVLAAVAVGVAVWLFWQKPAGVVREVRGSGRDA